MHNENHQAYSLLITDKAELEGLPSMFLDLFAQNAAKKGHEGAYFRSIYKLIYIYVCVCVLRATGDKGPWMISAGICPLPTYLKNL